MRENAKLSLIAAGEAPLGDAAELWRLVEPGSCGFHHRGGSAGLRRTEIPGAKLDYAATLWVMV